MLFIFQLRKGNSLTGLRHLAEVDKSKVTAQVVNMEAGVSSINLIVFLLRPKPGCQD
jgi:hypothetical protein